MSIFRYRIETGECELSFHFGDLVIMVRVKFDRRGICKRRIAGFAGTVLSILMQVEPHRTQHNGAACAAASCAGRAVRWGALPGGDKPGRRAGRV